MIRFAAPLVLAFSIFFSVGCGTLDKLSRLNQKTTFEECTDLTTEIVTKACKNLASTRDKTKSLVNNINMAVDVTAITK